MNHHFEYDELDGMSCSDKIEYYMFNYYADYHISKLKIEEDLRLNCMTNKKSLNKKRKLKDEEANWSENYFT